MDDSVIEPKKEEASSDDGTSNSCNNNNNNSTTIIQNGPEWHEVKIGVSAGAAGTSHLSALLQNGSQNNTTTGTMVIYLNARIRV